MLPVWENIARQKLNWQQCYSLLDLIFSAGVQSTGERNIRMKVDYRRLKDLNECISRHAEELAAMLTEREDILHRNAFSVERTTHIVDLIEMASAQNGHYRSFLREPLDGLRCRFDGKYWPSLQQILQVSALENPETGFLHKSENAIAGGRGEAVPDFLRELFDCIQTARDSHWGLPAGFTLSDASLATLATVSLELDEVVTADRIKTLRHRLHREGCPGAWATTRISLGETPSG